MNHNYITFDQAVNLVKFGFKEYTDYSIQKFTDDYIYDEDPDFIDWFCNRYTLNDIECRSVKAKSKAQMSALQTFYVKKQKRLEELREELSEAETKKERFKINRKIIKNFLKKKYIINI